jgi:ABC-type branched-subunit amino acid transport system ATPase component
MGAYLIRDTKGRKEDFERVYTLFPLLYERRAQLAGTLSGGEQQMVAMGRALMARPKLLLMDEPTAGMAPEERDALMALAADLARGENIAVLFTEHDMDAVFGFAHRVIALHLGEMIAEGPPDVIRSNPRLREVYLGDA